MTTTITQTDFLPSARSNRAVRALMTRGFKQASGRRAGAAPR
jgi:hypothetical protein